MNADWHIDDRRHSGLEAVKKPFRPRTQSNMHQVRAQVSRPLAENVEYLFDSGRSAWAAVLDHEKPHRVPEDASDFLEVPRRRRPEAGDWYPVRELVPTEAVGKKELMLALQDSAPGSGSYILVAQRRRAVRS